MSYTEAIDSAATLTVSFDESGQKRFASVDYALDGIGSATWGCNGGSFALRLTPSVGLVGLRPEDKGHVVGTFSVPLPAGGTSCAAPVLQNVSYTSLTLTNDASGHVYRLDPVSRTYP